MTNLEALCLAKAYIDYVKESSPTLHTEANGTPPIDAIVAKQLDATSRDAPTEAMCDRARGFIMGLDLGLRTWAVMQRHLLLSGYPSLPYIKEQAANNPLGHITKWDVAECIYMLMTSEEQSTQE